MNTSEEAFYSHLTDTDSLDYIIREGFATEVSREVIPTEIGRKITSWAIDQYFRSGRLVAPSREAIEETWGSQMAANDIEIRDDVEQDSVQWAVDQLRAQYVDFIAGEFTKEFAMAVRQADNPDRPKILQEYSQKLHLTAQSVVSRRNELSAAAGIEDALKRYEERAKSDHAYSGITLGIKEIDDATLGIHNKELAIMAATSGGGKSWMSLVALLADWKHDRRTLLFTLENDVEMTYDRIACVHCAVPYEKWQRSECTEQEQDMVRHFAKRLKDADNFIVIQPQMGESTGQAMIRRAVIEDADSVIIDQLSHIEPVAGSRARQRNEIVAEIVRDLGANLKDANLPCLLLHQINREGRAAAQKTGRYEMSHMGEATQVENDATFVFAIYQSPDHIAAEWAELQMLKSRRTKLVDFELTWRPHVGDVRFRREIKRGE